jgi:hypothetical protein
MDVEYARLARDLPLPEGVVPISKPSVRQNAAPSYVSPKAISAASSAEVSAHILKVLILFIIMVFDTPTFTQSVVHCQSDIVIIAYLGGRMF